MKHLDVDKAALVFCSVEKALEYQSGAHYIDQNPDHKKPELKDLSYSNIMLFYIIGPAPDECKMTRILALFPDELTGSHPILEAKYRDKLKFSKDRVLQFLYHLRPGHIYFLASDFRLQLDTIYHYFRCSPTVRKIVECFRL